MDILGIAQQGLQQAENQFNRSARRATYVFSAFCAALVGLIIAAQLEGAHPATGESFELNAIAAVVLDNIAPHARMWMR